MRYGAPSALTSRMRTHQLALAVLGAVLVCANILSAVAAGYSYAIWRPFDTLEHQLEKNGHGGGRIVRLVVEFHRTDRRRF